jgi:hypothetical protein
MVAAAAMSLPRVVPAFWSSGVAASNNTVALGSFR